MEVKLNILESSSESYLRLRQRLNNSAQELGSIASSYRDITSVGSKVGRINSIKSKVETYAVRCGSFSQALERIEVLYQECENRISDECDGVRRISADTTTSMQDMLDIAKKVGAVLGGSLGAAGIIGGVTSGGFGGGSGGGGFRGSGSAWDTFWSSGLTGNLEDFIGDLADFKSTSGRLESVLEYIDYFGGSELAEYFGKIGGNGIFDVAGYLDDYDELVEAWNSGDADGVRDLIDKYAKKVAGKVVPGSGLVGNIYGELAWNFGSNLGDGILEFIEEPSFEGACEVIWNSTAGAFWETGTDLGKDVLQLWHTLTGTEFDEADYDMAMDWLGNAITDTVAGAANALIDVGGQVIEGAAAAGEAVGEAIAEGVSAAGEAIAEGVSAAGDAIAKGVSAVGDAIGDAAKGIGDTISSWLPW